MTVRAKTLVKDKFWIVEQNGQKLGTLSRQDNNGWIFLSKQKDRQVFANEESLRSRFGFNIFDENKQVEAEPEQVDNFDVHGFLVLSILTIQCSTCRSNCRYILRHPNQKVYFVQDTT